MFGPTPWTIREQIMLAQETRVPADIPSPEPSESEPTTASSRQSSVSQRTTAQAVSGKTDWRCASTARAADTASGPKAVDEDRTSSGRGVAERAGRGAKCGRVTPDEPFGAWRIPFWPR